MRTELLTRHLLWKGICWWTVWTGILSCKYFIKSASSWSGASFVEHSVYFTVRYWVLFPCKNSLWIFIWLIADLWSTFLHRTKAVHLGPNILQSTCVLGEIWNTMFNKRGICSDQDLVWQIYKDVNNVIRPAFNSYPSNLSYIYYFGPIHRAIGRLLDECF